MNYFKNLHNNIINKAYEQLNKEKRKITNSINIKIAVDTILFGGKIYLYCWCNK